MLQKGIAKKILVFSIGILLLNNLFAQQQTAETSAYRSFVAPGDNNSNSTYFLLYSSSKVLVSFLQKGQLLIARQLNDTAFIVQVNDKSILPSFKQMYAANNNWKLSPALSTTEKYYWPLAALITVTDEVKFTNWAAANKIALTLTSVKNNFIIDVKNQAVFTALLQQDAINFISAYNRYPKEELQINNLDLSTNKINVLHSKMPLLNGNGFVVSIKENRPDTNDIDLTGRYISNSLAATAVNAHATIMATMAAGAGNSYYLGQGVAWAAAITSSSFSNLLPDADLNYTQNNITVQNHSYGVGVENFYGADAAAYDASALTNDKLLFVFSAGNSGALTPATGNYAGIAGVANLTGSFKMAKNIITVGAVDSFNTVAGPSSKGPAYDGRIKPEMVAYGEDGSSGAAALVSGTAIVLQQAYKNNNGTLPSSALVKAVLLNSCDDVANNGIDFTSGFGSLNAYKAAAGMLAQKYFTGTVANNATQTFGVTIPSNLSRAKFTLVWNDIAAPANAFKAIKNDLDLQVQSVATSQTWLPWVLNSFPHKDSLQLLPVRKRDSLNTVEQITIDNPTAGNYNITVKGFDVSNTTQPFAIAYQFDTANVFNWVFPTATDNIFPAATNLLRWSASFGAGSASMEYSINNGASWQLIPGTINLNNNHFRWTAPDTNVIALLRMTVGSQQFVSDPFTISAKPDLSIGFNCSDSALLYWNKSKGITDYQLYGMGAKYLQPLSVIKDTQFVFNKAALPYLNFAVAPIIKNQTIGIKSYATNYSTQGVDCYIKNLLADLVSNDAVIKLDIGSTYLVNKIVFEKLNGVSYNSIFETSGINGLNYTATDTHLQKGINTYRVVIYLSNGKIIYSDLVNVVYFADADVLIYPNPALQNNTITIQLKLLNNQTITILDLSGRKVFQQKLTTTDLSFKAGFAKGLYIISITDPENNTKQFSKIIIQ
ncbi:S8 family peptidase [Ferruginibacter sp. SUN106]|uniref:S8 family peptidase n=1 Tax=Ferruginibacter sp. SUN106 TaxID=2978348 RepID=UPI003D35AFD1